MKLRKVNFFVNANTYTDTSVISMFSRKFDTRKNLSLVNVHSVRRNCCHLRHFVIDNSVDVFCISETWLYDDDSAIISASTPESHV